MAALLHDSMEDCGITKLDLKERFGEDVAELVDGLTKLDKLQFNTREENQAESFRKMLLAMARDVRVILIKLADRTHNMRTMSDMPRSKWGRISSETLEIYAPIAHRLGLNQTYRELQDLFQASASLALCHAGKSHRSPRRAAVIWSSACRTISTAFARTPARLLGRESTLYSLYQRMQNQLTLRSPTSTAFASSSPRRWTATPPWACCTSTSLPGRFKDYIAIARTMATSRCTPRWSAPPASASIPD
jgi:GTP pyrophosphokinase